MFLISGALAGLVGMQQMFGDKNYLPRRTTRPASASRASPWRSSGRTTRSASSFAALMWGVLSRGETALQLETDVPREIMIILQGILIMSVVVTYQVAKRRLLAAATASGRRGGGLEDSDADEDIDGLARDDR